MFNVYYRRKKTETDADTQQCLLD